MLPLVIALAVVMAEETIPLRPPGPPPAIPEKIEERGGAGVVDRAITNVAQPTVTVYLPDKERATGAAVVIAPGGGYQRLAIDKEGHDVARWLTSIGVAGLVLKYRLPDNAALKAAAGDLHKSAAAARVSLEDAAAAVALARKNAARWNLRPEAVGMMGFSAGGHLAAMAGMLATAESRPSFLALIYPGIPRTLALSPAVPPAFLVHATDDKADVGDTSVRFYLALRQAGIPAELHLYRSGGHGFGTRKTGKTSEAWTTAFATWLKETLAASARTSTKG